MHELDYKKVFNVLVEETKKYLLDNNLKAMVLGISGGIDSTVTAAICHEVSKQIGIPLIGRSLPIKNKDDEFNVSKLVGEAFCDDFKVVYLNKPYLSILYSTLSWEGLISRTEDHCFDEDLLPLTTPIASGNIQARLRMIYLYNLASIHNGLVMSTDNQTEYQLGFWTIHGDVGDFDPLQDLWKTEVYGLAEWILNKYAEDVMSAGAGGFLEKEEEYLHICEALKQSIRLIPTDGLGISNSDLDQIGAKSYAEVDAILQDYFDYCEYYNNLEHDHYSVNTYLEDNTLYDIEPDVIEKVLRRHIKSEFKRKKAPIYIERDKYV